MQGSRLWKPWLPQGPKITKGPTISIRCQVGGANSRRDHASGGRGCPRGRKVPRVRQSADGVGQGQMQRRFKSDHGETGKPARQRQQQRWRQCRLHFWGRCWRQSTVTQQPTVTTLRLGWRWKCGIWQQRQRRRRFHLQKRKRRELHLRGNDGKNQPRHRQRRDSCGRRAGLAW